MEDFKKQAKDLLEECGRHRQIELIATELVKLDVLKADIKKIEERINTIAKRTNYLDSISEPYFQSWLEKKNKSD